MQALYKPRWRPDGEVVVFSFHFLNPVVMSSTVSIGHICGKWFVVRSLSRDLVVSSDRMCFVLCSVALTSAFLPRCRVISGRVNGVPSDWAKCWRLRFVIRRNMSALSLMISVFPVWSVTVMVVSPCDRFGTKIALSL